MRKLALLSLDYIRPKDPAMPLGVASIIANLKKHSVDHHSLFYNVRYDVVTYSFITANAKEWFLLALPGSDTFYNRRGTQN